MIIISMILKPSFKIFFICRSQYRIIIFDTFIRIQYHINSMSLLPINISISRISRYILGWYPKRSFRFIHKLFNKHIRTTICQRHSLIRWNSSNGDSFWFSSVVIHHNNRYEIRLCGCQPEYIPFSFLDRIHSFFVIGTFLFIIDFYP